MSSRITRSARTPSASLRPQRTLSQSSIQVLQSSPQVPRSRQTRTALSQPPPVFPTAVGGESSTEALSQPNPRMPTRAQSRINSSVEIPLQAEPPNEQVVCPLCALHVEDDGPGLMCDKCNTWFHPGCLFITEVQYTALSQSEENWHCDHCKSVLTNKIKWGDCEGEESILTKVRAAYQEITSLTKNIFLLPRGKAASDFIKELTRLINLFVRKTQWERLALPLLHVFMPIMLQKPSKKSKARDHLRFLSSRLEKWRAGDLGSLMAECSEIQKRLLSSKNYKEESNRKAFSIDASWKSEESHGIHQCK